MSVTFSTNDGSMEVMLKQADAQGGSWANTATLKKISSQHLPISYRKWKPSGLSKLVNTTKVEALQSVEPSVGLHSNAWLVSSVKLVIFICLGSASRQLGVMSVQ